VTDATPLAQASREFNAAAVALEQAGYDSGPEELGVKPTGAVDAATLAAVEEAIAAAGKALAEVRRALPSPSPTTSPSGAPSTPPSKGAG
jgi:hypothetical protein